MALPVAVPLFENPEDKTNANASKSDTVIVSECHSMF